MCKGFLNVENILGTQSTLNDQFNPGGAVPGHHPVQKASKN